MFAVLDPVFSQVTLKASNTPSSIYSLKEIFLELASGFFQEIKKVFNFLSTKYFIIDFLSFKSMM